VYWPENRSPGVVTALKAKDYDDDYGEPFKYGIASSASDTIRTTFSISGTALEVNKVLDREETKTYFIPISISDSGSPAQTGTSTLTLVVADVNDNPMEEGHSSIFVYNYKVCSIKIQGVFGKC